MKFCIYLILRGAYIRRELYVSEQGAYTWGAYIREGYILDLTVYPHRTKGLKS